MPPVITSRQNPNTVQGSIRDNMCDTGTWLNETPSKRRSTIAMVPTNSMMLITWVDSVIAYM